MKSEIRIAWTARTDDIRNKEPQKLHGLTPGDIGNNELHGLRGLMV